MQEPTRLDDVFGALADPSRRAILARLAQGEATVGEVAAPLNMALPSVSKHVRILERSGLIQRRVDGRRHWLRLRPDGLRAAGELLDFYRPFWEASIDRLATLTDELAQGGPSDRHAALEERA
ncbi:MAG: metalloregulator ArsR/SmtB family transcription factor [Chloroflexota bacterium]